MRQSVGQRLDRMENHMMDMEDSIYALHEMMQPLIDKPTSGRTSYHRLINYHAEKVILLKKVLTFLGLSVGILVLVALYFLSPSFYVGGLWGSVGVFVLWSGVYLDVRALRRIGSFIVALSLCFLAGHYFIWLITDFDSQYPWLALPFQKEVFHGWVIIALLQISLLLWRQHYRQHHLMRSRWYEKTKDFLAIITAFVTWATLAVIWKEGLFVLSVIPMFFLFYCASRRHFPVAEIIGTCFLISLQIPILNAFFNSQQPSWNIAQISSVLAFISIFIITHFYQRLNPYSRFAQWAMVGQHIFIFALPTLW